MKKIFLLFIFSPFVALSQIIKMPVSTEDQPPPSSDSRNYGFTTVDSSKENKDELYLKAKSWLAKTFVSANSVIQLDDKEAGKIIGKGAMLYDDGSDYYKVHHTVRYTLTVNVKNNKYRLVLSDFINEGYANNDKINGYGLLLDDEKFLSLPYSKGVIEKVNINMKLLTESFKNAMKQLNANDF